jgi:hypothetical protein
MFRCAHSILRSKDTAISRLFLYSTGLKIGWSSTNIKTMFLSVNFVLFCLMLNHTHKKNNSLDLIIFLVLLCIHPPILDLVFLLVLFESCHLIHSLYLNVPWRIRIDHLFYLVSFQKEWIKLFLTQKHPSLLLHILILPLHLKLNILFLLLLLFLKI